MAIDRRRFFRAAGAGAALALLPHARLLAAAGAPRLGAAGYGPLKPVRDRSTGINLLSLPEGFEYVSFGWAREPLAGDYPTPGAHDGMGVVAQRGDDVVLARNHELVGDGGAFGPATVHYDPAATGGASTIAFDTKTGRASRAHASLSGTLQNCSGGVTPWGTWLSCEEFVLAVGEQAAKGRPATLERQHGFVFEVDPAGGPARPLPGLGVFRHEAAAVHAPSGHVYLTEDRDPRCGFYRFRPGRPGRLAGDGVLEMLRCRERPDLRSGIALGERLRCDWVRIEDPVRGHTAGAFDGLGVFEQGAAQGGAIFTRGEGCFATDDQVYFTSTNGGEAACGQVFAYDPKHSTIALVFESPGLATLDYPDNICFSPRGGLVICEDGGRDRTLIQGLGADGALFAFARNDVVLDGEPYGHTGNFRGAEWAGTCFSPDGRWLFANVYAPGFTVAITGPWKRGLI